MGEEGGICARLVGGAGGRGGRDRTCKIHHVILCHEDRYVCDVQQCKILCWKVAEF